MTVAAVDGVMAASSLGQWWWLQAMMVAAVDGFMVVAGAPLGQWWWLQAIVVAALKLYERNPRMYVKKKHLHQKAI